LRSGSIVVDTPVMPTVSFTPNLGRYLDCPASDVAGVTVAEALERVFEQNPRLRSYIVDEQGRLRQHVAVFVAGERISDRLNLSDPVEAGQDVFVMQALSGG
jgi:sulfur-carrier protein